jgi:hypothetical protein
MIERVFNEKVFKVENYTIEIKYKIIFSVYGIYKPSDKETLFK